MTSAVRRALVAPLARPVAVLVGVGTVLGGALGCADDGRELRAPAPGATAPPQPATTASTGPAAFDPGGGALQLLAAWGDGQPIAAQHTCSGIGSSPALAWDGVPAGTAELAITVVDTDADGFVHWIVVGIDPTVVSIDEGRLPEGALEGPNGAGGTGWVAPCPPPGEEPHHYVFTLYALGGAVTLETGLSPLAAIQRISAVESGAATLTATFQRS